MTTKPEKLENAKRRGALKKVGTSAVAVAAAQNLPEQWKAPMVESVMLPSHANTTNGLQCFSGNDFFPPLTLLSSTVCISDELVGSCFQENLFYPNGTGTVCLATSTPP